MTIDTIWPCHMTMHHADRDSHAAFTGTAELLSMEWSDTDRDMYLMLLKGIPPASIYEWPDWQRLIIVTLAERRASILRRRSERATSPHMRPIVLTNDEMLSSGRSAGLLKHPLLPICVLGYVQEKEKFSGRYHPILGEEI